MTLKPAPVRWLSRSRKRFNSTSWGILMLQEWQFSKQFRARKATNYKCKAVLKNLKPVFLVWYKLELYSWAGNLTVGEFYLENGGGKVGLQTVQPWSILDRRMTFTSRTKVIDNEQYCDEYMETVHNSQMPLTHLNIHTFSFSGTWKIYKRTDTIRSLNTSL